MDLVAHLNAKDGRAGNIDVAGIDQRTHVLVEERQQQDADMRTVDVCIGHDDDLVVARLGDIEVAAVAGTRRDAAADRGNQRLDGVTRERAMVTNAFDVQNLAAQGQNRLDVSATAVLGRTACRVALYDEELGQLGIAHRAVGELTGQGRRLEQALAAGRLARLAGGIARLAGLLRLLDDLASGLRVLLEVIGKAVGHDLERQRAHIGAAELGLGLALKLRIGQLDRDNGRKALAHIVAGQIGVFFLEQVLLARIVVDHAGERGAEALKVHAALGGVDVVGKRHDVLAVAAIPLQGNLDLAHLGHRRVRVRFALDVDGLLKGLGDVLALVEELDEVDDAALVAKLLHVGSRFALVGQHDFEVLIEERRLLQTVVQRIEIVDAGLEDLVVGPEGDGGARRIRGAHDLHLLNGLAARELHLVGVAVATNLNDHALGQCVDDGDANAVQAARNLIGRVIELTAGVQDRHDDLERRDLFNRVLVDGDAAPVVDDRDGVVGVDRHLDLGAETGHGLVDGVVNDLPHQVMQTAGARRADIHARALTNGLETFENLNLAAIVIVFVCHTSSFSQENVYSLTSLS